MRVNKRSQGNGSWAEKPTENGQKQRNAWTVLPKREDFERGTTSLNETKANVQTIRSAVRKDYRLDEKSSDVLHRATNVHKLIKSHRNNPLPYHEVLNVSFLFECLKYNRALDNEHACNR